MEMGDANDELKRDYEEQITKLRKTDVSSFYVFSIVFQNICALMHIFHISEIEERRYH